MMRLQQQLAAAYAASSQTHWLRNFRILHSNSNEPPIPGRHAGICSSWGSSRGNSSSSSTAVTLSPLPRAAELPKQWLDAFIPTAPLPAGQAADITGTQSLCYNPLCLRTEHCCMLQSRHCQAHLPVHHVHATAAWGAWRNIQAVHLSWASHTSFQQ
jgi:hypothetical protein